MRNTPKTPAAFTMIALAVCCIVNMALTIYRPSPDTEISLFALYCFSFIPYATIVTTLIVFRGHIFTTEKDQVELEEDRRLLKQMIEFANQYLSEKVGLTKEEFKKQFVKKYRIKR